MNNEPITIYLTRESFCMADDVNAPHIQKFLFHDGDCHPERTLFVIIGRYFDGNLPNFSWRGYAGGQRIVDVKIKKEGLAYLREINLVDNWHTLLLENKCIYFLHNSDKVIIPEVIDPDYTFEEAEKIYNDQSFTQITTSKTNSASGVLNKYAKDNRTPPQIEIAHENDWFVATDTISHVASQGETIESAIANLKEAVELYLENNED